MFLNINDGRSSLARGKENLYDKNENFQYLKYGEVISTEDANGLGRIKVRIKGSSATGGDKEITDENLPYAFPMLPKHINVTPKKGEMVWVFVFDKNRQHVDRIYIGPIISQLPKLDYDDAKFNAMAGFSFGPMNPTVDVKTIPELKGVFPDENDVSIQGRYNTDITQKNNEIIIRAGKFETSQKTKNNPFPFKFNNKTQGYIQLKNNVKISKENDINNKPKLGTVTNIVSNKINLITHSGGSPRFNVTGQDELIDDLVMDRILTEGHQLPFGDVLVEYLRLLKNAVLYHVHNGNGNVATDLTSSGNVQSIAEFKDKSEDLLNSMLSKNIRIN